MRTKVSILALFWFAAAAHAGDGIVAVLERSQATRLEQMGPADQASEAARTVRRSFETVVRAIGIAHPLEFRVIDGDVVAETLQGRVVVANVSLARLSEGERTFILAHELGHVELRHWQQTERVYQKWVPGPVAPEQTDPVAGLLGRDVSQLAHRQELEADGYALRALHRLGLSIDDATTAFVRMGTMQDTATHPGTRKRLAALRAAEAELAARQPATTRNEPIDSPSRPD